jgi:hypothetical protein
MSEFQYYEFVAIERRLTEADQAALRAISSRAEITATSLTNSYSYGNFRGDPDDLMDEHFDAMIYVASWGTHTLRLRVPRASVGVAALGRYGAGRGVVVRKTKTHAVVTLSAETEDGGGWVGEDGDGWMKRLVGLRDELLAGDLRPLYLGWLAAAFQGEVDEDEREPAVPAGLRRLTKAQKALAEFLYVDDELIAAAAKASAAAAPAVKPTKAALAKWVASLPAKDKNAWLVGAALDDGAAVGAAVLQRYRKAQPKEAPARATKTPGRTAGELMEAAGYGGE